MDKISHKETLHSIRNRVIFTFKNCESPYCTPVIYIIAQQLYFNKRKKSESLKGKNVGIAGGRARTRQSAQPACYLRQCVQNTSLLTSFSIAQPKATPLFSHVLQISSNTLQCVPRISCELTFAFHNVINIHLLSAVVFLFWEKKKSFAPVPTHDPDHFNCLILEFLIISLLHFSSQNFRQEKCSLMDFQPKSASVGHLGCSCIEMMVESNSEHLFLRGSWFRECNSQRIYRRVTEVL